MRLLIKTGQLFYGTGIFAVGLHQIILRDFRPEILSSFPAWAHQLTIFPILIGIALLFAGIVITGIFEFHFLNKRDLCLYLGFGFLLLFIFCQLPDILIFNSDKIGKIDTWFGAGETLAYCGGAFVMAGSFPLSSHVEKRETPFKLFLEKLVPFGRIFFSALMILFGSSHFVFTDVVSTMVPKFFGVPLFWTYLAGIALIGAGIAIILKIWIRPVALLLGIMLFIFFIFFHIPDAIANPSVGSGTEIVRATVALLFSGTALVIAFTDKVGKKAESFA